MMSGAKLIGLAKPLESRAGGRQGKGRLRQASLDPDERLGNLGFEWMSWPLESKQPGRIFRSNYLQLGFPAESCGRKTHRRQGMPQIVLAIAEGTLAVFPGFPPRNGRESQIEASGGGIFPTAAQFQCVITAQIMICSTVGGDSLNGREKRIRFGWMKVAAGRIDSQRPPVSRDLFPGRKSKRELKKTPESSQAQTLRGCGLAGNKFNKRRRILLPRERKLHAKRSLEFTEGIGLIFPREIPEAARI